MDKKDSPSSQNETAVSYSTTNHHHNHINNINATSAATTVGPKNKIIIIRNNEDSSQCHSNKEDEDPLVSGGRHDNNNNNKSPLSTSPSSSSSTASCKLNKGKLMRERNVYDPLLMSQDGASPSPITNTNNLTDSNTSSPPPLSHANNADQQKVSTKSQTANTCQKIELKPDLTSSSINSCASSNSVANTQGAQGASNVAPPKFNERNRTITISTSINPTPISNPNLVKRNSVIIHNRSFNAGGSLGDSSYGKTGGSGTGTGVSPSNSVKIKGSSPSSSSGNNPMLNKLNSSNSLLSPTLSPSAHPSHLSSTHFHTTRRESFLYKPDTDFDAICKLPVRSASIASEQ